LHKPCIAKFIVSISLEEESRSGKIGFALRYCGERRIY